jgi:hypothetical protein
LLLWIGPGSGTGSGANFLADPQHFFDAIVWFSALPREARIALYSLSVGETELHPLLYSDPLSSWETGPVPPPYQGYLKGVEAARQANRIHLDRKVLAVQSGGRVLDPSNDLASQINRCVADASAWYTLSFDPHSADHPDEYHDLRVLVGKPGLTARTNTGYYDQPYYYDQPNLGTKRVTVEQLGQVLGAAHGSSDAEMARQLSDLELTERLSSGRLTSWKAGLRGTKARQALVALADASAFLGPPAAEILADAPPDSIAQRLMLSRTVDYLTKTIPKLPNFFATRTTVLYEETAAQYEQAGKAGIGYHPLHVEGSFRATVLVRDGKEVVDSGVAKGKKPKAADSNLTTRGTFGPILVTVILDAAAAQSGLTWSRWEQGAGGPQAVFRYVIPAEKSHYEVVNCCLPDGDGTSAFQKHAGYHGEITIDPASGAILRLALEADLKSAVAMVRSDIMVEYGPVEIGPNTYTCPVRSVSISRGRTLRVMRGWDESFRTFGPFVTTLNDVAFGEYHMFRAESRVLPGFNPVR